MDDFAVLDLIEKIAQIDFMYVLKVFGTIVLVFWLFVLMWVIDDARSRSEKWSFVILAVLLVSLLNVVGLVIYFIIRPQVTLDDAKWVELEHRYLEFETAGLGECYKCGFNVSSDFNVCPNCGTVRKTECKNCGTYVFIDWKFCPYCGEKNPDYRVIESEFYEADMKRTCYATLAWAGIAKACKGCKEKFHALAEKSRNRRALRRQKKAEKKSAKSQKNDKSVKKSKSKLSLKRSKKDSPKKNKMKSKSSKSTGKPQKKVKNKSKKTK